MSGPKVTIRAGSENTVRFRFEVDGQPIDLSQYMEIELLMKNLSDNQIVIHSMSGGRLSVVDATQGLLDWRPESTDFASSGKYVCYFQLTDQNGDKYAIPDEYDFVLVVRNKF